MVANQYLECRYNRTFRQLQNYKKSFSEKQLFPEKNSTELHSGNIAIFIG